jgi:hypothetical protein
MNYKTINVYADENYDEILKRETEAAQTTQMRAGAILENALRDAVDVETEYDRVETGWSSADARGPYRMIKIEAINCGWSQSGGFYGIGYLNSDYIPYAIERVYRAAYEAGKKQGFEAGKDAFSAQYNGITLYRRDGCRFVQL